jgi:TolA-binding protein
VYRNYLITEKGIAQLIGGYSSAAEKAFDLNVAYINKFDEMKKYTQTENQKKLSVQDILIATLEEQKKIEKRIDIVENKVENEIRIDHAEQRKLQKAVSIRVFQRLDVINAERKLMFSALYRDLKDRFGVASYRDIKRKDLKETLLYVQNWIEKAELREAN